MELQLTWSFGILSAFTVAASVAAVTMRNLVHCALALAAAFAGLAGMYLQLNAQFAGFAQLLIYVGAVAILIVFAILLTRGADTGADVSFSKSWLGGGLVALLVFAVITGAVLSSRRLAVTAPEHATAPVADLGSQLMSRYILPLEVLGLLLTAALIGAVVLAVSERKSG